MPPLVSICIPAYNAERTIAACLRGVLNQELDDAEVIVIDNCSTDRTVEIAKEILSARPNCRVLTNSRNVGRVGNWNRCLEEAQGQYLKFAFTNDVLYHNSVPTLVEIMNERPDLAWVGSPGNEVREIPLTVPEVQHDHRVMTRSATESLTYFTGNGFVGTGSLNGMLYRRSFIVDRKIRFLETLPYFADFLHAVQMCQFGGTALVDVPTYYFNAGASGRYHFAGMSNPRAFFKEHRQCTDLQMAILRDAGLDSQIAVRYLEGRFLYYLGQGWNLGPLDAWIVFRGHYRKQLSIMAKVARFRMKQTA